MLIKQKFQIFISLLLLTGAGTLHNQYKKPLHSITKQEEALNLKNGLILPFNLGLRRLISSVLWIQTLVDSDIDHYKQRDLNNWMYLRFDSMLKLDPKFMQVYTMGGQYLSIIKDDDLGAKNIYDRGLIAYPGDNIISYQAIFHYVYELHDKKSAYNIYKNVDDHYALPHAINSLMAAQANSKDDIKLGIKILKYTLKNQSNATIVKKIKQRIIELKKRERNLPSP